MPKTSPTAKINEKAETVLQREDTGACPVSVISTYATKELWPAENTFLKETTITRVGICLLRNRK